MLTEHDQEQLLHCRRLGHEVTFGYCRQEAGGKPCRLIVECWWTQFDVHGFLKANLPAAAMTQIESASTTLPSQKMLSLLEMIQQAKDRHPTENPDSKP